jgi:hypothetical protein
MAFTKSELILDTPGILEIIQEEETPIQDYLVSSK